MSMTMVHSSRWHKRQAGLHTVRQGDIEYATIECLSQYQTYGVPKASTYADSDKYTPGNK
jgi:hypothetical protein